MTMYNLSTPRWTGLCWLWTFNLLIQLIPPITWDAVWPWVMILFYESGLWTGGRSWTRWGQSDNGS